MITIRNTRIILAGCLGLLISSMLSACVPSPSSSENDFPKFTLLSTFYTPQDSNTAYIWQDSTVGVAPTKIVTRQYVGLGSCPSNIGYSFASNFRLTDATSATVTTLPVVITDSIVIELQSVGTIINPIVMLGAYLEVGSRWSACDHLMTPNGTVVVDSAKVDNYFATTNIGGVQYSDVFHVTYSITGVVSGPGASESEYQKGATVGIYFTKGIGPTYIVVKDPNGRTIRIGQLIETRPR